MRIAFPPPVARGFDIHKPGVLTVLHVAHEHTVFDQNILARWRAFVVNGDRPAPVGDGAVVQNCHTLGRHLLAHQTRESRASLAVKIPLKPMAHRLVQQNTGPARAKHDVHRSCGGRFSL